MLFWSGLRYSDFDKINASSSQDLATALLLTTFRVNHEQLADLAHDIYNVSDLWEQDQNKLVGRNS